MLVFSCDQLCVVSCCVALEPVEYEKAAVQRRPGPDTGGSEWHRGIDGEDAHVTASEDDFTIQPSACIS